MKTLKLRTKPQLSLKKKTFLSFNIALNFYIVFKHRQACENHGFGLGHDRLYFFQEVYSIRLAFGSGPTNLMFFGLNDFLCHWCSFLIRIIIKFPCRWIRNGAFTFNSLFLLLSFQSMANYKPTREVGRYDPVEKDTIIQLNE